MILPAGAVADRADVPVPARHVLVRTSAARRVSARHVLVGRAKGYVDGRSPGAGHVPPARTLEAACALALILGSAAVLMVARASGLAVAISAALVCLAPGLGIHSLRRTDDRADRPALVLLLSLSWSTLVATGCAYARLTQPVVLFVLIALPGAVGGLMTARRSSDRFGRPFWWPPEHPSKPDALACAVYGAAAISMVIAFLRLDPGTIGEWGLLPALGPAFAGGVVAAIAVVVASAVARRPAWVSALGMALVVCAFTLPPGLASGRLLGGWSYKHLGVVDLIRSGGAVSDPRDLFQSWPGFFAAAADVDRLSGAQDVTYANQATLLFLVVAAVALWTATERLLPGRHDVAAVAVLILTVTQWEGQVYYSPQSLAWCLSMLTIALILPRLPPPHRTVSARLPGPVRDVLSWLRRGDAATAVQPDTDDFSVYALMLAVLAVIVTHQLTPWMMIFQLTALMIVGWSTRVVRLLLLLLAVGTVGWLLIHHAAVSAQGPCSRGFRIGNASGLPQHATSAPQELAARASRLIALMVWGGTLLVALMSFRRPGRVAVPLALAFAPFCWSSRRTTVGRPSTACGCSRRRGAPSSSPSGCWLLA